jgi:hypothetical protein
MSTKNVVGDNIVSPKTTSWYYVSEGAVNNSGNVTGALDAAKAWMAFHLSRLATSLFTYQQTATVLVPVPVRNIPGRNRSWR